MAASALRTPTNAYAAGRRSSDTDCQCAWSSERIHGMASGDATGMTQDHGPASGGQKAHNLLRVLPARLLQNL